MMASFRAPPLAVNSMPRLIACIVHHLRIRGWNPCIVRSGPNVGQTRTPRCRDIPIKSKKMGQHSRIHGSHLNNIVLKQMNNIVLKQMVLPWPK